MRVAAWRGGRERGAAQSWWDGPPQEAGRPGRGVLISPDPQSPTVEKVETYCNLILSGEGDGLCRQEIGFEVLPPTRERDGEEISYSVRAGHQGFKPALKVKMTLSIFQVITQNLGTRGGV